MSGREPLARRAIAVEGYDFLDNSVEVARLWVENGGPATCLIQPERLAEPEMFGMLMVDTIRHAAIAYSQCHGISEAEALARIWEGLDMERGDHSTPLGTLQDYGKPN
jgi:Domain of unknown function (DUF5076)